MISVKQAYELVLSTANSLGTESVSVHDAIGRVLAEEVKADRDMPPFDRAAMDGICIRYSSYEEGQRQFAVESIAAAGSPKQSLHDASKCIEIMTGAPLANGTDTVIRYEDIKALGERFEILKEPKKGQNIHFQGSDTLKGYSLLKSGMRIKAIDINILASVGKSTVEVFRLPRVAVMSSGDELVEIDEIPKEYQIRKSNVYMLQSKLKELGITSDALHFTDDVEEIYNKIKSVLNTHDVLLISGGVSKGKYDFIPEVLQRLGCEKLFHKVAQRPGKPFWFGKLGNKVVFAFPGNPVSTLACFHKYFIPWLSQVQGVDYQSMKVVLGQSLVFKPDLNYLTLASLSQDQESRWIAEVNHGNGSGDMLTPSMMDGFVELPRGREKYEAGEAFDFYKF